MHTYTIAAARQSAYTHRPTLPHATPPTGLNAILSRASAEADAAAAEGTTVDVSAARAALVNLDSGLRGEKLGDENLVSEHLAAALLTQFSRGEINRMGRAVLSNCHDFDSAHLRNGYSPLVLGAAAARAAAGAGTKTFNSEVLHLLDYSELWDCISADVAEKLAARELNGAEMNAETLGQTPNPHAVIGAVGRSRALTEDEQRLALAQRDWSEHVSPAVFLAHVGETCAQYSGSDWKNVLRWLLAHDEGGLAGGVVFSHLGDICAAVELDAEETRRWHGDSKHPWQVNLHLDERNVNIFDPALALLDATPTVAMLNWVDDLWGYSNTRPSRDGIVATVSTHPEMLPLVLCGAPGGEDDTMLVNVGEQACAKLDGAVRRSRTYSDDETVTRILSTVVVGTKMLTWLIGHNRHNFTAWLSGKYSANQPTAEGVYKLRTLLEFSDANDLYRRREVTDPDIVRAIVQHTPGLPERLSRGSRGRHSALFQTVLDLFAENFGEHTERWVLLDEKLSTNTWDQVSVASACKKLAKLSSDTPASVGA